jgi:hypothetical protein
MGTTVWTNNRQQVDNSWLYTAPKTTVVQDVLGEWLSCARHFVTTVGLQLGHPQSTALITVISSLHTHPQTTLKAQMPGVRS